MDTSDKVFLSFIGLMLAACFAFGTYQLGVVHGGDEVMSYVQGKENGPKIASCIRKDGKVLIQGNSVFCVKEEK